MTKYRIVDASGLPIGSPAFTHQTDALLWLLRVPSDPATLDWRVAPFRAEREPTLTYPSTTQPGDTIIAIIGKPPEGVTITPPPDWHGKFYKEIPFPPLPATTDLEEC